MTQFISPVGFSSHRVTQSIAAYGPSTGDTIILVHPIQPDPGAQEQTETAVRDVRQMLNGLVRSITVETTEIDTSEFQGAVDELSEALTEAHNPVVCLGAGATDITYPLFVATLSHINHVQQVMSYSDVEKVGTELSLPDLTTNIPGRMTDLFLVLAKSMNGPPMNIRTLAEEVNKSEATVSRHVDQFEKQGLVEKKRCEQSKVIDLTPTGRLFARNALLEASEN